MLDDITLYWLSNSAASSARLYWENWGKTDPTEEIDIPTAFSIFPAETVRASRRWAERVYTNIVHWGEPPRGGHFASFEQPALFVDEVRAGFRAIGAEWRGSKCI